MLVLQWKGGLTVGGSWCFFFGAQDLSVLIHWVNRAKVREFPTPAPMDASLSSLLSATAHTAYTAVDVKSEDLTATRRPTTKTVARSVAVGVISAMVVLGAVHQYYAQTCAEIQLHVTPASWVSAHPHTLPPMGPCGRRAQNLPAQRPATLAEQQVAAAKPEDLGTGLVFVESKPLNQREWLFQYGTKAEWAFRQATAALEQAQAQQRRLKARADELRGTEPGLRRALEAATQTAVQERAAAEQAKAQAAEVQQEAAAAAAQFQSATDALAAAEKAKADAATAATQAEKSAKGAADATAASRAAIEEMETKVADLAKELDDIAKAQEQQVAQSLDTIQAIEAEVVSAEAAAEVAGTEYKAVSAEVTAAFFAVVSAEEALEEAQAAAPGAAAAAESPGAATPTERTPAEAPANAAERAEAAQAVETGAALQKAEAAVQAASEEEAKAIRLSEKLLVWLLKDDAKDMNLAKAEEAVKLMGRYVEKVKKEADEATEGDDGKAMRGDLHELKDMWRQAKRAAADGAALVEQAERGQQLVKGVQSAMLRKQQAQQALQNARANPAGVCCRAVCPGSGRSMLLSPKRNADVPCRAPLSMAPHWDNTGGWQHGASAWRFRGQMCRAVDPGWCPLKPVADVPCRHPQSST